MSSLFKCMAVIAGREIPPGRHGVLGLTETVKRLLCDCNFVTHLEHWISGGETNPPAT